MLSILATEGAIPVNAVGVAVLLAGLAVVLVWLWALYR